jgi:hypothetical protein
MSKWQEPLVIQEVYPSGAIRLHGDVRGKPHVVNGQHFKHYLARKAFVRKVQVVHFQTPESVISSKSCLLELQNQ